MSLRETLTNKAREQLFEIYKLTSQLPQNESFGITSQLRRASLSILLNIKEGYSRFSLGKSNKELTRFLLTSFASLEESLELINIIRHLNYSSNEESQLVILHLEELAKLLNSTIRQSRHYN